MKLTRATLLQILTDAMRAPSGDNCQPWRFRWDGMQLDIFHERARGLHSLNRKNHASLLTLGCLLEGLEIAAQHAGYRCAVEVQPNSAGPWSRVGFHPSQQAGAGLHNALLERATDRRLYHGGSVSDPVFATLRQGQSRFAPARLYLTDEFSKDLISAAQQIVFECDVTLLANQGVDQNFAHSAVMSRQINHCVRKRAT